jgi:serpin B
LTGCAGRTAQDRVGGSAIQDRGGIAIQDRGGGKTSQSRVSKALNMLELDALELREPHHDGQRVTAGVAAQGANDFAFRLSALLVSEVGAENFVCSPYSVWLPLVALANATDSRNIESQLEALGVAGLSVEDLNNAASRMLFSLTKQRERQYAKEHDMPYHNPLKIANAVFVSKNNTLKREFAQTFLDYYRGWAMAVDFNSDEAVQAVNQWASDNTDGLITEIIREFDPDTVAALANAIYFSDRWAWQFDETNTRGDVFHSPSGETSALYMLREGDCQLYYEDDKVQAMPLSFLTGGGMCVILPKDGDAVGLLSSMTCDYFYEIQRNALSLSGKLLLPRFSIGSDVMDLSQVLEQLGIPLFDRSAAPLTGGLVEEDIPVWITDVAQKAVIEVDERGTTAAAVTIITVAGEAMNIPTDPFVMICNSPFVFILYGNTDDGGNQILFTGVVNRP